MSLQDAIQALVEHPRKIVQVVLAALLAAAFVAVLLSWIFGVRDQQPLLMLFGVTAIVLVVSETQAGIPLTAAVLIVGTVVGGEQFIIALTSLVTGNESETAQAIYGSNGTQTTVPVDHDRIASLIVEAIRSQPPADAEVTATKILDRADIAELANMVRAEEASIPFTTLSERSNWPEFVDAWEDTDYFQEDMRILRTDGLVDFPGTNYLVAQVTSRGQDVIDVIREGNFLIEPLPPTLAFDQVDFDNDPLVIAAGGQTRDELTDLRPVHWYRLEIVEGGRFIIETRSDESGDDTDTELALFRRENNTNSLLVENDDGGQGTYSRIVTDSLSPQEDYFIRVTGWLSDTGGYELRVDEE